MFTNYLKIAWRYLSRQTRFTALNVLGLSIGVAAVLLIYQIVQYELSFNKNFNNYNRIIRVVSSRTSAEAGQSFISGMPTSAMIAAQQNVSQFEATSRIRICQPTIMVLDPNGGPPLKKFNLPDGKTAFFAEPSFFKIFDFGWLSGDQSTALAEPNSVVLSQSMAENCFDHWEKALGQTVILDNIPMIVRGIMADAPSHCNFPLSVILSYATLLSHQDKYEYVENWMRIRSYDQLFALLTKPEVFGAANTAVAQIGKKEYPELPNFKQTGKNEHFLQHLSNLHFDTRFSAPDGLMIEKSRLWVLSCIGFLVLLMACFNFVNLSTAQALSRAKEVGIRKTLGSDRRGLFVQFISETGLIVLLSISVGVCLAKITFPFLHQISNLPKDLAFFSNGLIWLFLGLLVLAVTLFSGMYPAMILSRFNPVRALKNEITSHQLGSGTVRKGLVIFQFAVTQALLIGTIVSLQQMNFIQHMDLGYSKDLIYIFGMDNTPETRIKMNNLKTQIRQIAGVEFVTMSNLPAASQGSWQTNFALGKGTKDQPFNTTYLFADADFEKTYGVQLLAGKWYDASDTTTGYVINETLMRKAGISNAEHAIGQELRLERDPWHPIVGVVKDFHSKPLQQGFEPMVLANYQALYKGVAVKIRPKNISTTIAAIKRTFDQTYPEQVFTGNFFDISIAHFYSAEERFAKTCKGFSLLAIIISCLGLFGLVSLVASQRTREVGIRKVLGASIPNIMGLIAKDFLILVAIAIFIASPIGCYFMHHWLQDFTYRIDISGWILALAGVLALLIAFLTISFQAIKAAIANPIKSLRSE